MKSFFLALFMFAFCSISYAQNPVVDTHPRAQIYVIDPQSGQETPVSTDLAILFKNSLIELVRATPSARAVISGLSPEYKNRTFTVTQMGVETNINGYQISLDYQAPDPEQNVNLYTFVYHADDNTLYYYDQNTQAWVQERILANNVFNLRKAAMYAQKFNEEFANQPLQEQGGQVAVDASVDLDQPVDADVAADTAPPEMPEYEQPECPSDGYLWQPGYWAFSRERGDYYWVPGAWVAPPNPGVLWTPPYWGYEGNRYVFHIGYWGDHIGFYGGINYGYGYSGHGYYGGEWREGRFHYNTAVVRVNRTVIRNVYENRIVIRNNERHNRNSFNGGRGGVDDRPTAAEVSAGRERHYKPTAEQNGNQWRARQNPNQFTKGNPGGKPANLAVPKVIPFHPQNNGGNKVGQGVGGKQNQPQGNNPGRPTGRGNNPGKPGIQNANPGNPNAPGANPDKPTGVGNNQGNPNRPGANPNKPAGLGNNPGNPNAPGANPNKPAGAGNNPANPNAPAANPNKPAGLGNNPGNPNAPGANPNKPAGAGNNPANPNAPAANPNKPAGLGNNPGNPNAPGANPNKPAGAGNNPANPNAPAANPNKPAGLGNNPGNPNAPGANPNNPAGAGNNPANPNAPAANPNKPAGLGNNPGNPNAPATNPNRPARVGNNPGGQGNNPAKPAGLPANPPRPVNKPANPPKPVIQQAKPAKPAENKPKQQDKPVKQNN